MRLQECMKSNVETIEGVESATVALERMRRLRVRHLVVTNGREIRGVVTDRDLAAAGSDSRRVEEFMVEEPVTATPNTSVREAANLLRGHRIGCLPVVDEHGALVGILTTTDILDLVGRGAVRPVAATVKKTRNPRSSLRT